MTKLGPSGTEYCSQKQQINQDILTSTSAPHTNGSDSCFFSFFRSAPEEETTGDYSANMSGSLTVLVGLQGNLFFFFNSCQRNNTDDFTVTECDVTSSSLHKIACLSLWIFAVQVKFTLTSRTVNLCFSSLRMGTSMFFFFFFPRIETLYKCQMSSVR